MNTSESMGEKSLFTPLINSPGERVQSNSFPKDTPFPSFVGRAVGTDKKGEHFLLSFDEFLGLFEQSVFVKVNRIEGLLPEHDGDRGSVVRMVCLMEDGRCIETPLYSIKEAQDLLSRPSMHLKPALWLGRSILLTKGSLTLPEKPPFEKTPSQGEEGVKNAEMQLG